MKAALSIVATLLLSSMLWAQAGTAAKEQPPAKQAQPGVSSSADTKSADTQGTKTLQDTLTALQEQIDRQQQEIETLKEKLAEQGTPHLTDASLHGVGESPARAAIGDAAPQDKPKESPLSFRIGQVDFTPGGFLDLSNVWRSENTGNPTSTSFGSIPFSNTIQGHLTEYRLSAQHSRVFLRAHTKWGENDITGYIEADFNGNDAANVFVGTNPHTNRLRHYYVDIKHHKFEFLGGQTWGWLIPNKTGVGTDQWVSSVWDPNYNVGLNVTRQAQIRFIYHPTEHWALGADIENPEQYVGAGEVIFPFAFNAQLGPQLDANNQSTTPNLHPDFLAKLAYDTNPSGHHIHFEVTGILHSVKVTHIPIGVAGATFTSETATGGGIEGFTNIELIPKKLTFYATGFYSDGVGRYLLGLGPDTVIVPIQTGPAAFTLRPSLVHTASGLVGFEAQITKRNLLYAYYGGAYFQRNAFPDVTSPLLVKPIIGFGGINSPNSANRALQEPTFGWNFTMWKDPNYGALQILTQYSYVTRAPWFVAAGAPKNAHLSMVFVDLRYTLP